MQIRVLKIPICIPAALLVLLTSGRHAVGEFELASVWEALHDSSFVHCTHWLVELLTHEFTLRPERPAR
jgi:hypothetical protein